MMNEKRPFTVRLFNTFEPVTTFYRDLIPYWLKQQWQVEVVMSHAQYRAGRPQNWQQEGVTMRWTPGKGRQADSRINKLLIMLTYILGAMWHTAWAPPVDRNIFLTQPPLFFLWGYCLKRWREQPYYIVLMDLYPDVAIQAGLMNKKAFFSRLLLKLSRFGLYNADGVIVIGRCMRERMQALGVPPERIFVVPNWADETAVMPIPHEENTFRKAQQWQDKFVVLYSGNIGTSHAFTDILEVSKRLHHLNHLVFAFIGQGQRRQELESYRKKHQLNNIILLPFQPQETLAQSLSSGNIQFVSLAEGYEGLVVPSKVYGILAAGLPVIYQGSPTGEIAHLLKEESVGCFVPLGNPDALEKVILTYLHDPQRATVQGKNARQLAESKYSRLAACTQYTAILSAQEKVLHDE